jgi:ribosome-binding factor A
VNVFVFFVVILDILDRIQKVAALQGAEGFLCDQVDVIGSVATSPDLQFIIDRGLQLSDCNTFLKEP